MKVLEALISEFAIFGRGPEEDEDQTGLGDDTLGGGEGQGDEFSFEFGSDDDKLGGGDGEGDEEEGHDPETCKCPCHKHEEDGLDGDENIEIIDGEEEPEEDEEDEEDEDFLGGDTEEDGDNEKNYKFF